MESKQVEPIAKTHVISRATFETENSTRNKIVPIETSEPCPGINDGQVPMKPLDPATLQQDHRNVDPFQIRMREIENRDQPGEGTPRYMFHYLRNTYWTGLSPYMPQVGPKKRRIHGWGGLFAAFLQRLVFWGTSIFSILSPLLYTKVTWLVFATSRGLDTFADVCFWVVTILAVIYLVRLFVNRQAKVTKMLKSLDELNNFVVRDNPGTQDADNEMFWKILAFQILSILACALKALFQSGLINWSFKKWLLDSSEYMSWGLFLWKPNAMQNATIIEALEENYGKELTKTSILFGVASGLTDFAGELKMDMLRDLAIFGALSIDTNFEQLTKKLEGIDYKQIAVEVYERDYFQLDGESGYWAHYEKLMKTVDEINDVFDDLLKFVHINTLTLCARFLMHCLDGSITLVDFLFYLYAIGKTAYAYKIAKDAKNKNKILQKWITDWSFHSKDEKFQLKVPGILKRMENHPIGFGLGNFIIGEGFIFKVAGLAGSLFTLKMDGAKDQMV